LSYNLNSHQFNNIISIFHRSMKLGPISIILLVGAMTAMHAMAVPVDLDEYLHHLLEGKLATKEGDDYGEGAKAVAEHNNNLLASLMQDEGETVRAAVNDDDGTNNQMALEEQDDGEMEFARDMSDNDMYGDSELASLMQDGDGDGEDDSVANKQFFGKILKGAFGIGRHLIGGGVPSIPSPSLGCGGWRGRRRSRYRGRRYGRRGRGRKRGRRRG
jgi:hypothetical protein